MADETKRLADETERLSDYTNWIKIFTFGLFCAAVVQAAFFWWQLRLIKDGGKDTATLASAARDSAEAAKNEAEEAKLSRRAYLSVERAGIRPNATGSDVIGHVTIRNVGHRPAREVSWFVKVVPSSDFKFKAPEAHGEDVSGSTVVFPDTDIPAASAFVNAGTSQEKEGFLYVWGVVFYKNGIDIDEVCWTKFCHRYNRALIQRAKNGGIIIGAEQGRYHENGNDYK